MKIWASGIMKTKTILTPKPKNNNKNNFHQTSIHTTDPTKPKNTQTTTTKTNKTTKTDASPPTTTNSTTGKATQTQQKTPQPKRLRFKLLKKSKTTTLVLLRQPQDLTKRINGGANDCLGFRAEWWICWCVLCRLQLLQTEELSKCDPGLITEIPSVKQKKYYGSFKPKFSFVWTNLLEIFWFLPRELNFQRKSCFDRTANSEKIHKKKVCFHLFHSRPESRQIAWNPKLSFVVLSLAWNAVNILKKDLEISSLWEVHPIFPDNERNRISSFRLPGILKHDATVCPSKKFPKRKFSEPKVLEYRAMS